MQGLMWCAAEADGMLTYSSVEAVKATHPFYLIRLAGGLCFSGGMLLMAFNVFKTIQGNKVIDVPIPQSAQTPMVAAQ